MRKQIESLCIMAAVIVFTAFGPVAAAQQSATPDRQDEVKQTAQTDTQLSNEDKEFIKKAAHGGMIEVELGRMGVEKATNQEVKQFAQRMIDDHTRANDELMQLASSKGITIPKDMSATDHATHHQTTSDAQPQPQKEQPQPPDPPAPQKEMTGAKDKMHMDEHKAVKDRLSKLSGAEFDQAFMEQMVKDHTQAVTLFENQATNGKDAEVKAWAAKTLPTLKEHLQLAQEISGRTKVTPSKPETSATRQTKNE